MLSRRRSAIETRGDKALPEHVLNISTGSSNRGMPRRKRKLEQNHNFLSECKVLVKNCEMGRSVQESEKRGSVEESDEGRSSDLENASRITLDSSIMKELRRKRQLKQNQHNNNNDDEHKSMEKSDELQNSDLENVLNVSTESSNMRQLQRKHLLDQIQRDNVPLELKDQMKKSRELAGLHIKPEFVLSICMGSSTKGQLKEILQLEQNQHEASSECKALVKGSCESDSLANSSTSALSFPLTENVRGPTNMSCSNRVNGLNHSHKGTLENQADALDKEIIMGKQPVVRVSRLNLDLNPDLEQQRESTDESDDAQEQSDLSAYERKRLKNIKENAKFLKSLQLLKMASSIYPAKKTVKKRDKPPKIDSEVRRSKRLQRIDPAGVKIPETLLNEAQNRLDQQTKETIKPPGPLPMAATNKMDVQRVHTFLRTCSSRSQTPDTLVSIDNRDIARYESQLKGLKLRQHSFAKVVPDRIYSLAVHPTQPRFIVAAGDKKGHVGLYGVGDRPIEESVYTFAPHIGPVSTLHFSPSNYAHLLSLSYDGTVRCGDCNTFVFDEVYRNEEGSFSSFDFLTVNNSVLIVSHWDSLLSVVDRRTPGTTYEMQASVGMSRCRTVSVHPLKRELCLVAGAKDVFIYDVRMLYSKKTQPVLTVPGHTRTVSSAYFSPQTGHRILTTCADDMIRIYNTNTLGKSVDLITKMRHNNYTGRWLTCFRAVWDPKHEGYFAVGSMARPRRIEVFNEKGDLVHSLWNEECLSSVCAINAFHPVKSMVVGGNSSGRVHAFF